MIKEQIIMILLVVLGVLAALIPIFIEGMEIIGLLLSLLGFVLVIPLLQYSRRKKAYFNSSQ